MTTPIFGRAIVSATIVTLLALFSPIVAWAHDCGPETLSVNKVDSVAYAITGESGEKMDYAVVVTGNPPVATIDPLKIKNEGHGIFNVTGIGHGTTTFAIYWDNPYMEGRCEFKVTVTE